MQRPTRQPQSNIHFHNWMSVFFKFYSSHTEALTLWCWRTDPLQPCGCGRLRPWTDRGRWSSAERASTETTLLRRCSAPRDTGWTRLDTEQREDTSEYKSGARINTNEWWVYEGETISLTNNPLLHGVQWQVFTRHLKTREYFLLFISKYWAFSVWCWSYWQCLTVQGWAWWREQRWERAAGRSSTGQPTDSSGGRPSEDWPTHRTGTGWERETRREQSVIMCLCIASVCVNNCSEGVQIFTTLHYFLFNEVDTACSSYRAGNCFTLTDLNVALVMLELRQLSHRHNPK